MLFIDAEGHLISNAIGERILFSQTYYLINFVLTRIDVSNNRSQNIYSITQSRINTLLLNANVQWMDKVTFNNQQKLRFISQSYSAAIGFVRALFDEFTDLQELYSFDIYMQLWRDAKIFDIDMDALF